eukprot:CAMPEP_0196811042 /NCGR_PEP_ID=MMETSP1362-20130617/16918_1 /TAXON_ID=163516 /ORGANISM="Leptocylindrus danicus, Strain CCMP1856" /LENGTH=234 /DNA_ID=CAMNT_0042186285 /DNA_START=56 /DNA_END=760 /DNA_ORIENTATION=+
MTTTTLTSTTARAACRIDNLLLNRHLHRRSNNTSAAALAPIEQQCMHRKNDDDDEKQSTKKPHDHAHARSMHMMNMQTLQQKREYHLTTKTESVALAAGLAAVAVGAKAGQYGLRAFEEWRKNQPKEEPKATDDTSTKASASGRSKASDSKKKVNFFDQFGFGVGSKYYEGGFEDKMTRREAALILGVRESATVKRIKDAHRKILILNHPDTGGSTYMASKINEAKELLLKGKE